MVHGLAKALEDKRERRLRELVIWNAIIQVARVYADSTRVATASIIIEIDRNDLRISTQPFSVLVQNESIAIYGRV